MLHCCVQYNMPRIFNYIISQLAKQLSSTFTLTNDSVAPTCVFKWLKTADELQLDQLKDMCIDALGTSLLPVFHTHSASHKAVLDKLSAPTLADLVVAVGRCSNCITASGWGTLATPTVVCSCSSQLRSEWKIHNQRQRRGGPCTSCAFRPKRMEPRYYDACMCGCCKQFQSWAPSSGA